MTPKIAHALLATFLLGACEPIGSQATVGTAPLDETGPQTEIRPERPEGAAPGTCWERDKTPAVIDTITERTMIISPEIAEDGTVISEAVYETITRQEISTARREIWFETPCHNALDAAFITNLQRALAARGHYRGGISGKMDTRTRRAIRRYQAPLKLDSAILSLEAARKLGLIPVVRPTPTQ